MTKAVLTTKDIMEVVGAGRDKARKLKKEVQVFSTSKGRMRISTRKCLVSDFSELYGIPIETIERMLDMKKGA